MLAFTLTCDLCFPCRRTPAAVKRVNNSAYHSGISASPRLDRRASLAPPLALDRASCGGARLLHRDPPPWCGSPGGLGGSSRFALQWRSFRAPVHMSRRDTSQLGHAPVALLALGTWNSTREAVSLRLMRCVTC